MIITATQTNVTVTPRKLRLVAFAVKQHSPLVAIQELTYLNKEAARVLLKVMKQAVANAKNNKDVNPADLTIKEIVINKGRVYKRGRASARGRSKPYEHVHSHVTVKLATPEVKPLKDVKEVTAPVAKKLATSIKEAVVKSTKPAAKKPTAKKVTKQIKETK